jgi:hypothetical protein
MSLNRTRTKLVLIALFATATSVIAAYADSARPGAGTSHAAEAPQSLGIPAGHLPPPGECRLWFPGKPAGHQPAPGKCEKILPDAPAGSWVLYRPASDSKEVHVRVVHSKRRGVVWRIYVYDAESGSYIRTEPH